MSNQQPMTNRNTAATSHCSDSADHSATAIDCNSSSLDVGNKPMVAADSIGNDCCCMGLLCFGRIAIFDSPHAFRQVLTGRATMLRFFTSSPDTLYLSSCQLMRNSSL